MDTFKRIYETNAWGNQETRSGRGSTLEFTQPLRLVLPAILRKLKVKVMLDAGCGDFNWMSRLTLRGIEYHGWDIVPEMIGENIKKYETEKRHFACISILEDIGKLSCNWPAGLDLILCRACLFHLSNGNVLRALANFKSSGATWLLTTTHPHVKKNKDIVDGHWRRLNLERVLGPAMEKIPDGPGDDGYLGLWRLKE